MIKFNRWNIIGYLQYIIEDKTVDVIKDTVTSAKVLIEMLFIKIHAKNIGKTLFDKVWFSLI